MREGKATNTRYEGGLAVIALRSTHVSQACEESCAHLSIGAFAGFNHLERASSLRSSSVIGLEPFIFV